MKKLALLLFEAGLCFTSCKKKMKKKLFHVNST